jgi:hypothetical protein
MKVDDQDVIDGSSGDDDSSNEDALSEGEGEQAKDTNNTRRRRGDERR